MQENIPYRKAHSDPVPPKTFSGNFEAFKFAMGKSCAEIAAFFLVVVLFASCRGCSSRTPPSPTQPQITIMAPR